MKKIEFDVQDWDEIKDKEMKILISNLEQAMNWFRNFGLNVEKDEKGLWWMKVNYNQLKEKSLSKNKKKVAGK